jgi:hypothetical protein
VTDLADFRALLADVGVLPAGVRPRWRQHWHFGQVRVAVADVEGRTCCVESLPEHTDPSGAVVDVLAKWAQDEDCPLAELVAVRGVTAVYIGLPGETRLVDHVVRGATRSLDPATADFLAAAADRVGAALARLHGLPVDRASAKPPAMARYLRADPALDGLRRALAATDHLAAHIPVLLAAQPPPCDGTVVPLHGGCSPDVVFVSEPGSGDPVVRCTRWAGATAGDPTYDLGTFLGPLVEVMLRIRRGADRQAVPRSIGRQFLAGYQAARGRALTAPETERLSSAVLLNLTMHYCYFVLQQARPMWTDEYVADLDRLARTPADLVHLVAG